MTGPCIGILLKNDKISLGLPFIGKLRVLKNDKQLKLFLGLPFIGKLGSTPAVFKLVCITRVNQLPGPSVSHPESGETFRSRRHLEFQRVSERKQVLNFMLRLDL